MEKIWRHLFYNEIRIEPSEYAVLLTEAPLNPKKNRERMLEILFDNFHVLAVSIVIQAVMSLYSMGRTTGVVVDSGDGVTHIVPIFEGYSFPHAVQRLDLAGRDLTEWLQTLMTKRGFSFVSSSEKDILGKIKEECCYVALDLQQEKAKAATDGSVEMEFVMPDGNTVTLNEERFMTPEPLFQPMLIGREALPLPDQIAKCIKLLDIDLRKDMYRNIVLSGGTTLFPNLPNRLQSELVKLTAGLSKCEPRVLLPDERRYVVWKGAAVLAGMPNFTKMCVWPNEYEDHGSGVVHSRCLS
ncbi:unnamed protein product [Amoebophrya sp. A120]|nr:unnamed protein product [Amoebophrya sp. A120]|eukprot:GSA120T00009923001.1